MSKDKGKKSNTSRICDICGKEVKSVYYDFTHNVSGHKNCIKYYDPNKARQLELPLEYEESK